jgi:TPR repeat protein/serine/threonine protein kinase
MLAFLRCVAEAVVETGIGGLAQMVPGGEYAYNVASSSWKKYQQLRQQQELRAEIEQLANTSFEAAREEAVRAVRESLGGAEAKPEEIVGLELYLATIPESIRASLKRPDDPSGKSVPAGLRVRQPDDLLRLLPARPPRFLPGAGLPGKSGWVLERLLGVGGFGEVWLARHPRMTSLAGAVKFCLGQSGEQLIHEADLIDRVKAGAGNHPNLVPLLDVNLEGDTPWLMFEYISGGVLTDWIHKLAGKPPEDRIKQVMAAMQQLLDAVGEFHALKPPIVHRDLKPSNILLDKASKKLRITDFGIGSVTAGETLRLESRGESSRGGALLSGLRGSHTPLYASPQQRNGAAADPRDDVHALGVIAYQMLTGALQQGAGPDFADDLRDASVGEDVIALLGRCVAGKAERRPRDANELRKLWAGLTQTAARPKAEPVRAEAPKPPSPAPSFGPPPPPPPWFAPPPAPAAPPAPDLDDGDRSMSAEVRGTVRQARAGSAVAMYNLGVYYRDGQGVAKDGAKSVEWFRKAAEVGYPTAMYNLGVMYTYGQGVPRNVAEGVAWYRRAAGAGNTTAMYNLGVMYRDGDGVAKDQSLAVDWFRQGADGGDPDAMNNLGTMYGNGRGGLPIDKAKAAAYYRQAAEAGNALAMRNLAIHCRDGVGVPMDFAQAMHWFKKAADEGDAAAMLSVGALYENGQGVPINYREAFAWYARAAEAGDAQAMYNLAALHESGQGTRVDKKAARAWYEKSLAGGNADAKQALARLR